jgi:hypothetical protein
MKKSIVEIFADLAVVSANQDDMKGAVDYLSQCVKELDKKDRPSPSEWLREVQGRFDVYPEAGC